MDVFRVTVEESTGDKSLRHLKIRPLGHKHAFKLEKQSTCSISLINVCDDLLAFKVSSTTSPEKSCVRPDIGLISPNSTCEFTVTMQAPSSDSVDVLFSEKLVIQSKIVPLWTNLEDVTPVMFTKDKITYIEENIICFFISSRADSVPIDIKRYRSNIPENISHNAKVSDEDETSKHKCLSNAGKILVICFAFIAYPWGILVALGYYHRS